MHISRNFVKLLMVALACGGVFAQTRPDAKDVKFKPNVVIRNVFDKLTEFKSVKDFGAVGDGITDDTEAFQRALDEVSKSTTTSDGGDLPSIASSGVLLIPNGDYLLSNLKWRSYVNLVGESPSGVFIIPSASATGYLFDLENATDRPRGIHLSNFSVAPNRNVSVVNATPPTINVFNFEGFEKQCGVSNVHIYNINGVGIKTGDTQDMLISGVEIRFVTKPLQVTSKEVYGSGIDNYTNALKFVGCRIENSGMSTITNCRSTHFVACKFEGTQIEITTPHGLDFVACDFMLTASYTIIATGTTDRGLKFIGGSTDTGLDIGVGSNTALFLSATGVFAHMDSMSFRGHAPNAIYGKVSLSGCTFAECDRPFVLCTDGYGSFSNMGSANDTGGTGLQSPYNRDLVASYEVSTAYIPSTLTAGNWYQNTQNSPIIMYIRMSYDVTTFPSSFEIKTRHNQGAEYSLGTISHPAGGGAGVDIMPVILLPGEWVYTNRTGSSTVDATQRSFLR